MIRVLILSKPYVASAYRNKLVELAKQDGLEVGLIAPTAWGTQQRESSAQEIDDSDLIFKEGDTAALASQIASLTTDSSRSAALRAKASARVRAHYTNQQVAADLAALIREIAPRR